MTTDMNDMNRKIIAEFREKDGKVGGMFEGAPMLLLHTTGAKSGAKRVNPLMYRPEGAAWVVFASKGGAPSNPDWFHNVRANAEASIEVGTDTVPVRARIAEGAERERIWSAQKQSVPTFAEYDKTSGKREIPVVVLERR